MKSYLTRLFPALFVFAIFGCGGQIEPVDPAVVTPEQEKEMKDRRAVVDQQERQEFRKSP